MSVNDYLMGEKLAPGSIASWLEPGAGLAPDSTKATAEPGLATHTATGQ